MSKQMVELIASSQEQDGLLIFIRMCSTIRICSGLALGRLGTQVVKRTNIKVCCQMRRIPSLTYRSWALQYRTNEHLQVFMVELELVLDGHGLCMNGKTPES